MSDANSRLRRYHNLSRIALVLAFGVILLGAWVRLTGAGLGCPDWPGCYGALGVPSEATHIEAANEAYPERPLEAGKAWREMIHRYFAGTLGLLVLALAVLAWRNRQDPRQPVRVPLALLALIIFQALLGMWTVTLLLKPLIVVAHLLGGMSTLALLGWMVLATRAAGGERAAAPAWLRRFAAAGLIVLFLQIALGGWTSSNYAALACPDLPTCQLEWWPEADFGEAFVPWRGLGVDYEGGVLEHPARVAIHLSHRLGALFTFAILGSLALAGILRAGNRRQRRSAILVGVLLLAQVALGLSVVWLGLPLAVAVAHNGTAAVLLLALIAYNHSLRRT